MRVLALLSRKGGVGKTTLAIHLAVAAQQAGRRVMLVDTDPQRSAAAWWQARDAAEPALEGVEPAGLAALLAKVRDAKIDLAIVDTRPSVEADAVHVASLAEFLLVPARPVIMDLRAILGTLDIVRGGRHRAAIVLNACPATRGGVGRGGAVSDARRALNPFGVHVAPMVVTQRAAFSRALVGGKSALETEPSSKAAAEIRALYRFVDEEFNR